MSSSDFVVLKGGLTVPAAVLQLAWALWDRGLHMSVDGDMLTIGPREKVTDADRALIRRWKPHLLALISYDADKLERVQ
jgi:hypothetical protein